MKIRQLMVSSLGNILEWLDVGLFIYLAPIIGQQFFPSHDIAHSTIIAFGVFAAGFICRPLGSVVFGHLGDRIGRAKTLVISILAISFVTLMVGFLPDYQSIGIAAPILFTLLRLVQGLSVGGEYSGVMIYLAESAPSHRRGFFTSFAAVGANTGFLLATLIAILLNTVLPMTIVQAWGWRIPFICSGLLGLLIFYFRLNLVETSAYSYLQKHNAVVKKPLLAALQQAPGKLLQILGLTCMGATFYYVFFGFMPTYLVQYFGVSLIFSLVCQAFFLAMMLVWVPLAGRFGDQIGRKKMLLLTAFGMILFALPCFALLQSHFSLLIFIGLGVATLISSMEQGSTLITVVENCPLGFRYSGVSIAYNLGNTVFGGLAPLMVSVLTQKINHFAPAYYIIGMSIISLLVIFSLKETYQSNCLYEIQNPA